MTTTQRYLTMCDTCGETFQSATMHHLDTSPECGECRNERLAAYITCRWAIADEPSEPCDHPDETMTGEGMYCPVCDTITQDVESLRYDFELERAALMDDHRYG
jgi:hypothetical protein